jgi:hypothetical protein
LDSARIVGYKEVILERHLLAGEVKFYWEIAVPTAKHGIGSFPAHR